MINKMFLINFIYSFLMFLAYPFVFIIFMVISLFDKNVREGHFYRLGLKLPPRNNTKNIWIHAGSIGEVVAVQEIIKNFITDDYNIYLSTTTSTGYEMAKKMYKDNVIVFYNSLDLFILVKRLINTIKPRYMIIVEIEIWPSLLYEIYNKNIPLYLINGRIGFKELKGYNTPLVKLFLKNYYRLYTKILAQSNIDRENMITIGMPESIIEVTGNIKYDTEYNLQSYKIDEIKTLIPDDKYIIVVGSSHEGEESLILKAIGDAGIKDKSFVVIVPRNIFRSMDIKNIAKKHGYDLPLYSKNETSTGQGIIIDVIGDLLYWYSISNIVVMGGSFSKNIQGHNILEAIYFKKAVIVGQYMSNFEEVFLYMKEALFTTSCEVESISSVLRNCYSNTQISDIIGESAYKLLLQNKGATQKTIETIKSSLIL